MIPILKARRITCVVRGVTGYTATVSTTKRAADGADPSTPDAGLPLERAALVQHKGDERSAPRCAVFKNGQQASPPRDLGQISEILKEGDAFVWLDVVDPGPNDLALLQDEFKLHPLAVEDATSAHERPKIESYKDYWFVVVHGVTLDGSTLVFHEVSIFAGEKYLVTVRDDPPYPLDEIERRWLAQSREMRRDSGFLLYTILDTIVDGYFPVAEAFEEHVNDLEAALFEGGSLGNDVLAEIFSMKRQVQRFRRATIPVRDVLNPIIRGDLTLFAPEETAYYRDVYDHAVRVIEQVDSARDLINSALEIHLSAVANRQSEVNKQLTVIATIFLPLTFLTGFFGQNFGFMIDRLLPSEASFWLLGLGSEAVAVVILVLYFKRKRWF